MGLGSSWGSREEFLHPRDSHGRFRSKWKMAAGVVDAITNFLDKFNPRTFQSDGQAAQYLFNRAKPGRFGGGALYPRLHADYDEANQHIRAGDIDAPTQKFIKMMDDSAVELDSDIIISQTVGPDAFGLTPEQMGLEDGGIEDFTARLMADRGYSAGNLGTPLGHGPGKITIVKAVPKGTKVVIPARSQNDRGVFLDRDQEVRITKVTPDGRGGWYMMAIATPRTPGETPEPINRGPRGVGLSPQQREERVQGIQALQAKRQGIRSDADIEREAIQQGTQQGLRDQPAELPPPQRQPEQPAAPQQPAAPGEPPPRNEPVLKESVGGADTQGKGTTEIAQTPPEPPPTPEAPAAPVRNFREAAKEAGLDVPSAGKRRVAWNRAYGTLTAGRRDPGDVLRELDADIRDFKHLREDNVRTGNEDSTLDSDIVSLEQLADTISKEYGAERRTPEPKKAAPREVSNLERGTADLQERIAKGEVRVTPRRELPGEAGTREVTNIKAFKTAKQKEIADREERKRRLLTPSPEPQAPMPPIKRAPAKKATVTKLEEVRAKKAVPTPKPETGEGAKVTPIGRPGKEEVQREGEYDKAIADGDVDKAVRIRAADERAKTGEPPSEEDLASWRNRAERQIALKKTGEFPKEQTAPPTELPETAPGSGKVRMSQLRSGVPILVEQGPDGKWRPATKKTGATRITVQEVNPVTGRGGQRQVVGVDENGNRVEVESRANVQTFFLGTAPAKKAAAPAKKAAPAAPDRSAAGLQRRGRDLAVEAIDRLIAGFGDDEEANREQMPGVASRMEVLRRQRQKLVDGQGSPREFSQLLSQLYQHDGGGAFGEAATNEAVQLRKGLDDLGLPEAGPRAKKAAPKVPSGPSSAGEILARLNEEDENNVPVLTRDQASELVDPLRKAQLLEIAKEYSIPSPSSKTVPELKRAIVEAGVGRRLDSIAIRGFTGRRPNEPGAPSPMEVPEGNRIAVRGGGFVDTRTGELHGAPSAEAPTPEAAPDIDRMTKAQLLAHAEERGAVARPNWTKDKIKQEIQRTELEKVQPRPMGVFSDNPAIRKAAQAESNRISAEARAAAARDRGELPAEPNAPAAQKPIQAPDRREGFAEAWINTPSMANINESTAAGRSINEVRDDILKGKLTPDEGIRRLETDIELNKADLAEMQQELRGDLPADEREAVSAAVDKLRKGISDQENASSFIRRHFRKAPEATPDEIRMEVDPATAEALDNATPDELREAAKIAGYGDVKGSTKEEILQNTIKKIIEKQRAEKATPAKKLTPAPLVTKKSGDPDYVDARAIAEGLDMDATDERMLKWIQERLDGTGKYGEKPITPAAAGRLVEKWANGPSGPAYASAVITGVNSDNMTPELQAEHDQLRRQFDRWMALADRLKKTRRRPARKATEPVPEKPKLTRSESASARQVAKALDVEPAVIRNQILAKRAAAAPPPEAAKSVVEQLGKMDSEEEGRTFLARRTKGELADIARASNLQVASKDTKPVLIDKIVGVNIGGRKQFEGVMKEGGSEALKRRPDPDDPMGLRILARGGFREDKPQLENMAPSELADLEAELGIKRTSLDRGDRIAAIRARQADQERGASMTRSLPASGRKWNWETIDQDNMTMHGDSASMNLAQKLRKAGREEDAQYVADMRYRISNTQGEHSPDDVEKMVSDLKTMMDAEQDPALKSAYRRALDDIEAPKTPAPKLPESTPPTLRRVMDELNQIPAARRSGHFAGVTKKVSAVDRLAELIRKIESGNGGSIGTVQTELRSILRSFHESVDGAFQMWRLEDLIDAPDIKTWIRSFY